MAHHAQETGVQDFAAAFGEPLEHVLNFSTWRHGHDLATFYVKLREEVGAAVEQSRLHHEPMRRHAFSRLCERPKDGMFVPHCAGIYRLTESEVEQVHRGVVFNGATECCDGTIALHDSLLLTVVQIGVALVAYQGNSDTWVQRLYRRDLRAVHADPVEEVLALLKQREERSGSEDDSHDILSQLVRRTLMDYAERAALVHQSSAT